MSIVSHPLSLVSLQGVNSESLGVNDGQGVSIVGRGSTVRSEEKGAIGVVRHGN